MKSRLSSVTGFLSGLKLAKKFQILGVIAVILAIVPFIQFFSATQTGVEAAREEIDGFEPTKKLLNVVKLTQEHRGLAAGALSGDEKLAAQLPAKKAELDQAVADLDAEITAITDDSVRNIWRKAKQQWDVTSSSVASESIELEQSFSDHTRLISDYFTQLDLMLDYYGLSLDPRAENTFLIQAAYVTIPRLNEALGQLRALGTSHLVRAQSLATGENDTAEMTLAERTILTSVMAQAESNLTGTVLNLNKAFKADPELEGALKAPLADAEKSAKGALLLIRDEVAEARDITMDPGRYFNSITDTIGSQLQLSDEAVSTLGKTLTASADELRFDQILTSGVILLLMVVGAVLALLVMRTITSPVGHLQSVMEQLREGDSTVRAKLESEDEIGELARQFDRMVDEREAVSARIAKENEQLNESVLALLQGVAQLAQRDLTAKVPVAEDVTGSVSDALNLLSGETAKVLKQVTDISADVSGASLKVKEQSDSVLLAAEVEREQVEKTSEELQLAAQTIERIEKLAQSANEAADNAIRTTEGARTAVTATIEGITNTRDTIRETEKRIKRLGERSQEISGVVDLINTIAERTHILALNASMHAASAGEAGRGFAVVAEEVQRLAENARQATGQIGTLVNNIQVETVDTVNTMNAAITQVVDGSKLAEQAGEQMKITLDTTSELVNSVREIALNTREQAKLSGGLLIRAGDIRNSTEQTSNRLTEQAQYTENLVEYAKALLGAVRVFKLPA
ncbi:MAG: methyl-accepting chemotaxis protein [Pseudomonadota bacterium]